MTAIEDRAPDAPDSRGPNFYTRLAASLAPFDVVPLDDEASPKTSTSQLRRRRMSRRDDGTGLMTLMEDDGVLRWRVGAGTVPNRPGRRGPRALEPEGRIVQQFTFQDLPPNKIGAHLRKLDDSLTPQQGLFEVTSSIFTALETWRAGGNRVAWAKPAQAPQTGRALLFVHGTFSNVESLLLELTSTDHGSDFLKAVLKKGSPYSKVLAFNHPTLSASPIVNAAALSSAFRYSGARVDVISHSRGGLVARWWLEALDSFRGAGDRRGAAVFVGSPLAGTGLAAPRNLKSALDLLTNVAKALSLASKLVAPIVPFAHAPAVLFSMFGKITSIAASTPLLDAGVALIPGLAAQSREGANGEILRLREALTQMTAAERKSRFLDWYWFVRSDYRPEDPKWRFWRYFRKDVFAAAAAEVLFDGANDLIVDSASMTDLADGISDAALHPTHIYDFGESKTVHHCNYFEQKETVNIFKTAFDL